MRKPLVNEIVRSFMYSLDNPGMWPFPIFGAKHCPVGSIMLESRIVIPFILCAAGKEVNYFSFNRAVNEITNWLRSFSLEEQEYAVYLVNKYYGAK